MSIYSDTIGDIWLGTLAGDLLRFDPRTKDLHTYRHNPDDPGSISAGQIRTMHQDKAGTLWLGSDTGLNKFDRTTDSFIQYTEKDGLPSSAVQGILEDTPGNLWLSTRRGLARFQPQTGTFRNYDMADGLPNDEFSSQAYYRSASGEMLFAGVRA